MIRCDKLNCPAVHKVVTTAYYCSAIKVLNLRSDPALSSFKSSRLTVLFATAFNKLSSALPIRILHCSLRAIFCFFCFIQCYCIFIFYFIFIIFKSYTCVSIYCLVYLLYLVFRPYVKHFKISHCGKALCK